MARIGTRPIREPLYSLDKQPWHNYGQPPHVPKVEISQPPAPGPTSTPEPEFGPVILPAGGGDPSGFGIIGPRGHSPYESGGKGTRERYDRSKNYITGTKDPWPWGLGPVPEHLTQYFYDAVQDPRDTEGFANWAKGRR